MNKSNSFSVAILVAFLWTAFTRQAFAYLDPGTGSYLFQIALASLFGLLFALKTYWMQVKHFVLTKILGKKADTPEVEAKGKAK